MKMEISTREILLRIRRKAMGKCFGLIAASTKDNGRKELKMVKDRFSK